MTNHAVIVGYSGYEHFKPLDGVISTADCFRSMLSYRVDGSGVFDSVDQIIDEEPGQVNDKLSDIFAKVQKQDRVALILIGHGMVWGGDPSLRLASHLAKPEAENEAHWLTVSSIANKLEASTDADRLLILDCCGAGFYDLEGLRLKAGLLKTRRFLRWMPDWIRTRLQTKHFLRGYGQVWGARSAKSRP